MPNIIGTAPNQVPTNADLGSMAYQDSNAVKVKDITFNDGSSQQTAASGFGFKNRIINGAMMIDQRNAGASVGTTTLYGNYTLDRWQAEYSVVSKFSVQQNAGSVTPPAGYINYLGVTSSSTYSVGAAESFGISQNIEGLNVADLAWGTANAKTVTLSFQVYSSLTGTFGGSLRNSAANRSYPFSYTVSAANTWTTVSVTIAGDTTGTWLMTNGIGIRVFFSLGVGSSGSATAGSWQAGSYTSATGATSVVGTNGATFYITGVQLEKGSTATSFDYRPYGTELALCQRYYEKLAGVNGTDVLQGTYFGGTFGGAQVNWLFKVSKRASPTVTLATNSVGNLSNTTSDYSTVFSNNGTYPTIAAASTASSEL